MNSRTTLISAGFTAILAAALWGAAPHNPRLAPSSASLTENPEITLSVFPAGAIYAGEWISVAAAVSADPGGGKLQARLDRQTGEPLGESDFSFNRNSGMWETRLVWVWDSSSGEGWHTLYVP